MFKKCLENRITFYPEKYKCYLCHYELPDNNSELILQHIETDKHKERLSNIDKQIRELESEKLNTVARVTQKKIVRNTITYDAVPNYFCCRACRSKINGLSNVIVHINCDVHKNILQGIAFKNCVKETNNVQSLIKTNNNEGAVDLMNDQVDLKRNHITFNENENFYFCKICNCEISGIRNVTQHIKGNLHRTSYDKYLQDHRNLVKKKDVLVKKNSKNWFIDTRHCLSCQIYLKTQLAVQAHVMEHLVNEISFSCNTDIIQFHKGDLSKNKELGMKCLLCDVSMMNFEQLEKHLETTIHLKRLKLFSHIKGDSELYDVETINGNIEELKFNSTKHISVALSCTICNIFLTGDNAPIEDHLAGKKHNKNIEKSMESNSYENKQKTNIFSSNFYPCFLCEISVVNPSMLLKHYNTQRHKLNIWNFNMINECVYTNLIKCRKEEVIHCHLCNKNMPNFIEAVEHILGKEHIGKGDLLLPKQKKTPLKDTLKTNTKTAAKLSNNIAKSSNDAVKPSNNIDKSSNDAAKPSNNVAKSSNNAAKPNLKVLRCENTKKKIELKTSPEELIRLGFSAEHLDCLELDNSVSDVLNDLVKLDLDKSQQKQLPVSAKQRKLRTPQTEYKASSFHKTILSFGKHFIRLCIDSGEKNIYNIHPEKLCFIKLGMILTFPWESQRGCLACGLQFPDNEQSLFEHVQNSKHIHDLREMEADHKNFETYPDQFSDLDLAKFYMSEKSEDIIKCFACDVDVKNDNVNTRSHIDRPDHILRSQLWKDNAEKIWHKFLTVFHDIWYYSQVFVCEICKISLDFEIDFAVHLEDEKHLKKITELKRNGMITNFYSCPTCISYFYGHLNSYDSHCQGKFHIRFAQNNDFMIPEMPVTAKNLLRNLNEKIDSIINMSNNILLEKSKELELMKAIEETVKHIYPEAKAYTFGSRLSHLSFPDSDVDIFLDCNNIYRKCTTQGESQKYLLAVKEYFEKNPNTWIVDEILLGTRVPIIKLRHIPTKLKCDISFINGLSVEKSKLIR